MDFFIDVARMNGVKGKLIYNSHNSEWVCSLERVVNVKEELIQGKGGTLEEAFWSWRNQISEIKVYLKEVETLLDLLQLPKEEAKI